MPLHFIFLDLQGLQEYLALAWLPPLDVSGDAILVHPRRDRNSKRAATQSFSMKSQQVMHSDRVDYIECRQRDAMFVQMTEGVEHGLRL